MKNRYIYISSKDIRHIHFSSLKFLIITRKQWSIKYRSLSLYLFIRNNRTECKLIVESFPTIIQDNRTPFSPGASPNRARGRSPGLRKFLVVTRACPLSSISFSSEEESGECVLSCHWNPPTKANSVIMTPWAEHDHHKSAYRLRGIH